MAKQTDPGAYVAVPPALGQPLPTTRIHPLQWTPPPPYVQPEPEIGGYVWFTLPDPRPGGGGLPVDSPRIVVTDGTYLYAGDSTQGAPTTPTVYKISVAPGGTGGAIDSQCTAAVGSQARDIAIDATYVYAALWDGSNVAIIETATMAVLGYGFCGANMQATSVCCDGAGNFYVYALDDPGGPYQIQRFSTAACIGAPPGMVGPDAIYAAVRGRWIRYGDGAIWFCDGYNSNFGIEKIDPATMASLGFADPLSGWGSMSALIAAGSLWVTQNGTPGRVRRIDPVTLAVQATINFSFARTPMELVEGPLGYIYGGSQTGGFFAIDPATDTLAFEVPPGPIGGSTYRFDGIARLGMHVYLGGYLGAFGGTSDIIYGDATPTLGVFGAGAAPGQWLGAIGRVSRALESMRDVQTQPFWGGLIYPIAYDGTRVWAAGNNVGMGGNTRTVATPAVTATGTIDAYSDWQYGTQNFGMAAVEYGDVTSGLWMASYGFGEIFIHSLLQLNQSDGSVLQDADIVIDRSIAIPISCTVVGGKVYAIAFTPPNGMTVYRFVRVDPGTGLQDATSGGYDFSTPFSWYPPDRVQVAARSDGLWILAPGDPNMDPSALLHCPFDTFNVASIPTDTDVGMWTGGADTDESGNLWVTGRRTGDDAFLYYISCVQPDGTVLWRLGDAEVGANLADAGPLVCDRVAACVWVSVVTQGDGGYETRALRIDTATGAVTDSVLLLATDITVVPCVDMVVGA